VSLRGDPPALALRGIAMAQFGEYPRARRFLLLGRLDEAAAALQRLDAHRLPPALAVVAELIAAELALRSLSTGPARAASGRCGSTTSKRSSPRARS
jgi:hypothetical protein